MSKQSTRAQRIKTKSNQRRESKKLELRQEILKASTKLFLEHGYENFSLRQVAEAVGYSPTTIYLYFKNKEELLFTTALEGFQKFAEVLKIAYASSEDSLERLMAIGRAYVKFGLENPVHYQLMFMQRGEMLYKKLPDCEGPAIDSFGILQTATKECMEAGTIMKADPLVMSSVIWSHVHGIVSLAISMPENIEESAYSMLELNELILKSGLKGG